MDMPYYLSNSIFYLILILLIIQFLTHLMKKVNSSQQIQIFGKFAQGQNYYDSGSNDDEDSQQQQNNQDFKLKRNKKSKNSYLSKISELKNSRQKICDEEQEERVDDKDDVLKKNRQSAKNSRERKKIYISLLQNKVEQLKSQIQNSKKAIKNQYQVFQKLTSQIDPQKTKLIIKKINMQKKIFSFIQTANQNKQQIKVYIDAYLYKYDINGKYKSRLLNSQFQHILRLIFDHKLFSFWEKNLTDIDNNYYDILSMYTQNQSYHKVGNLVHNKRTRIFNILKQIKGLHQNIKQEGERIQNLLQNLAQQFGQEQILQFIMHPLYFQQKKLQIGDLGMNAGQSITSFQTLRKKVKM